MLFAAKAIADVPSITLNLATFFSLVSCSLFFLSVSADIKAGAAAI
jgi:hypothetical protein